MHSGTSLSALLKVRDLLISKKQRLIRSLKEALLRVPRRIVAAVAAKFGEVEKRLRMKPTSIEEVADQRQFVDALPRKVAELVAEMDAAQVLLKPCIMILPVYRCILCMLSSSVAVALSHCKTMHVLREQYLDQINDRSST